MTNLAEVYRDHVVDFHLAQTNWDCGCNDEMTNDDFCQPSQVHAWQAILADLTEVLVQPVAEPALALAA